MVRSIHERSHWTDRDTGEEFLATTPAWQHWTHNTFAYGLLRAADAFGPELSVAEQDRFVVEQHRAAELLGLDIQDGILSLLPEWATELWGIEGRPMSMRLASTTTRSFCRRLGRRSATTRR